MVLRVVGSGGAGGGDGLESRVAKVEAAVEHIQSDITEVKADIREMRSTNFAMFLITWGGLYRSREHHCQRIRLGLASKGPPPKRGQARDRLYPTSAVAHGGLTALAGPNIDLALVEAEC